MRHRQKLKVLVITPYSRCVTRLLSWGLEIPRSDIINLNISTPKVNTIKIKECVESKVFIIC